MSLNIVKKPFNLKNDHNKNIKKNSNRIITKTNKKKVHNVKIQDPYNSSNSSSQNKKLISPSFKNINNAKNKKTNNPPNNKSISNGKNKLSNNKKKKKEDEKNKSNNKNNKSYLDISLNKDILLHYKKESPLIPGQTGNCGNEILEILNLNGNNNKNKNVSKIKKIKKQLNNSCIPQSKINNNSIDENIAQFKNKKNNIITETITEYKKPTNKKKVYNNEIKKNIVFFKDIDIDNKELLLQNIGNDKEDKLLNNNNNLADLDIDEYLLNSSFENNKTDFFLLYNNNNQGNIKSDTLFLEVQLLTEKILELQKSYHHEFKNLYNNYNKEKKLVKLFKENKTLLKKKMINLLKYKEKDNLKEKNNIYIGLNTKKYMINDSININKNEIVIWDKMFPIKKKNIENKKKKLKLKPIFKNIVFDRYKSIHNKLNDIEKKIVKRLFKIYGYNNSNNINSDNKKGISKKSAKSSNKTVNNNNKGNNKIKKLSHNKNYNNNQKNTFRNKS